MSKENPINQDEKNRQEVQPARIEPQLETDSFSPEEQKKIVLMCLEDIMAGEQAMAEWVEKKRKDIQHLNSDKPSLIEDINKKPWMSDRNLGLAAGIHDMYQATLYATCWNYDAIHFRASEKNDVNNRDNAEKFMRWVVSPAEAALDKEVDDFISNKVGLGVSYFKVFWEVKYEWVDKRIPIISKDNKHRIVGYEIKTELRRRERGRMVNIDHVDDILIPDFGKDIQELPFFIEVVHNITHDMLEEMAERKIITNYKDGAFLPTITGEDQQLKKEDQRSLGSSSEVHQTIEAEKKNAPLRIHECYTTFRKNNRTEKYRFWVNKDTKTFLAGMPLRKIQRSGKIPYVGGPLRRRPGFIRGGSLTSLIAPVINALNNAFNQVSDFQTMENIPFGFYNDQTENMKGGVQDIVPMKLYPVDGNPSEKVYFPNLSRSMAWGYQFFQFCIEMIERLTGAASYFLTSSSNQSTATRDNIVEEKGQVKFGLWVKRIQSEISEGLNMLYSMYQDSAPPDLGTRVLGEDGKEIIKNLSIDSLKGNYDIFQTPDITNGSKAYEKQVATVAVQAATGGCVWIDPRFNPRGNWILWRDFFKRQGIENPEQFMPPQPKEQMDYSKEAEAHFEQIKQGDTPEPPGPDNPEIVQCAATFSRLKDTRYQELDEEYKPVFDNYLFKAFVNYQAFMKKIAQEHMEMIVAANAVRNVQKMTGGGPEPAPMGMMPMGGARPVGGPPGPKGNGFGGGGY